MNKKFWLSIDAYLLISMLGLFGWGALAIYSATHQPGLEALSSDFKKQIFWFLLGLAPFLAAILIPPKVFYAFSYLGYALTILILVLTLAWGTPRMGAVRWLQLGGVSFQPAEFAKFALILALARFLSQTKIDLSKAKDLLICLLLTLAPFVLVLVQPDLGSAMVFLFLVFPMMFWAGLPLFALFVILFPLGVILASFNFYSFLLIMIFLILVLYFSRQRIPVSLGYFFTNILIGLSTPFLWNRLQPYQQQRILAFLHPEMDPQGAGYQIIQSKVAVGSGGFWGKGLLAGTQTQLKFLPEQHTDFIFSVIAEEFGLVGAMVILLLFFILLYRGLKIAFLVKNQFVSLASVGIVSVFLFHILVNIGMTLGMLPITGIPLPFMSYGGSFLMTNLIMIGFLLNGALRRWEY